MNRFLHILQLLCAIICIEAVRRTSDVIINEVNLHHPLPKDNPDIRPLLAEDQGDGRTAFIELTRSNLQVPTSDEDYRLILVEYCRNQFPELVLQTKIDFSESRTYWVLGTNSIAHVTDMEFGNGEKVLYHACPWKTEMSMEQQKEYLKCTEDQLPDGPVAVLVLGLTPFMQTLRHWDTTAPRRYSQPLSLEKESSSYLLENIQEAIVDTVIIFGDSRENYEKSLMQQRNFKFLTDLIPGYSRHGFTGRGFLYSQQENMIRANQSLTRCPKDSRHSRTPYTPHFFRGCSFTPNRENICNNEACLLERMHCLPSGGTEGRDSSGPSSAESDSASESSSKEEGQNQEEQPEIDSKSPAKKRTKTDDTSSSSSGSKVQTIARSNLTPQSKNIILNVIRRGMEVYDTQELTAEVVAYVRGNTGYSRTTQFDLWSQSGYGSSQSLPSSQVKARSGRKSIVIDDFYQGIIRQTVYKIWSEKSFPTVIKVHNLLQAEINSGSFPAIGKSKLHRIMQEIGFEYVHRKKGEKRYLYERYDITAMRHTYLRKIRRLRSEGYAIFYQDETWANAHHTKDWVWLMKAKKDSLIPAQRYTGGFKVPSGAGKRIIINHVGSKETGFLPGCADIFIGETKSGDYHKEMNIEHWMEWFKISVIPSLPDHSVLVLDNALYHNKRTEESVRPTTAWTKPKIQEWLVSNGNDQIDWSYDDLKAELLVRVKQLHTPHEYLTDKIARESGKDIVILRLPVGHCELNPIELAWAKVKREIAQDNMNFKVRDVKDLANKAVENVTPHDWIGYISHVIKVENEFWVSDRMAEEVQSVEEVVVPNTDSDDDDNDEDQMDVSYGGEDIEIHMADLGLNRQE